MLFTPGYSKSFFLSLCLLFVDCSMLLSEDLLNQESPNVIGFYEQRDLELTGSLNQSHAGVFSRLDQTQTIFGQQRLMHHLTHPSNSLEILEKRQAIIRILQENTDLIGAITVLLEQIKENQHGLEYFLNLSGDTADKHVIENYYFSLSFLKKFNASTAALSTRDTAKKIGLFAPVVEHLMIHAFMHSLTHEEACTDHRHDHDAHGHNHDHDAHGHNHDHHGHGHSCNHWWDFLKPSKEVATILNILHLGVFANSVYEMVGHVQTRTAVLNHLYSKIAAVQVCFTSMNELYSIINEHSELRNACEQTDFFMSTENIQLTELMTLFQGNYFGTEESLGFFSSVGSTLRANTLLKQCLSTWQHALNMIGDIDAYVSISRLLNKHQSKTGKFSLVRFIKNSERPQFSFKGLWNPMLDADSVIVNDISLGFNENPLFMTITGPNKAGKSSILKALGLGIVLAQSFGFINAAAAEITILDKLLTYMTVTDDITKDTSLMVAEMGRADACIKAIEGLQPHQKACCLIDDSLFKGTTFQKGQDLAYTFVRTLGNFKNNCGMVATHTALLTKLELDSPLLFRNYYIPTITVDNEKVASTFLLQPGISSPDNVLAIVQSK